MKSALLDSGGREIQTSRLGFVPSQPSANPKAQIGGSSQVYAVSSQFLPVEDFSPTEE